MDLKQFRIGNYVGEHEYATNGFVHQIERVDCYCVPGEVVFSNGDTSSEPFGIILDEQWLLKFRFEKEYEGHGCYAFFNKECRIYLLPNDFEFELNTMDERHNLCRQYKYVHQLQNLYFALTGTELVVSR